MDSQHKSCVPKAVGQWKVGRGIGQGSSGRVRIARHAKTGQLAAVKIISKSSLTASRVSLSCLAEQVEREMLAIEREIVIMKLVNHPNIMHLYDVWETSSHLYLVLEYIQGGELLDYLCTQGPLPGREALRYFRQIIEAVDYLHRFNIAHRDLKLENILLDQKHNIRVADFGMAAWQIDISGKGDFMKTSCGSPHYAAPEVIRGEPYIGSAADIWSCGVILYAMLTARLPFELPELLDKVIAGKFIIPSFVDSFAQNLIKRMLTVDAETRIIMSEIFEHPFFKHHTSKAPTPALPGLSKAAHSLKSKSCIDPDIFADLRILWRDASDEDLIRSLLNDDKNWQKGVYHLLVNYHANRDAEGGVNQNDMAKRLTCNGNELSEDKAKGTTPGFLDSSRQFVAPARSGELHHHHTSAPVAHPGVESFISKGAACLAPNQKVHQLEPVKNPNNAAKWKRNRPLPPVPTSEVEVAGEMSKPIDIKQDCVLKFRSQTQAWEGDRQNVDSNTFWPKVESRPLVFSLGHNAPGLANSDNVPLGAIHPQIMKYRSGKIQSHHVAADGVYEENGATSDDSGSFVLVPHSSSLKKLAMNGVSGVERKFAKPEDRIRGQHVFGPPRNKRSLQLQQAQAQIDTHPISDNGEVPKHTWLHTIFRVKSSYLTRHTLYSVWDIITTRNECRRLLMNMDIQVQVFHQAHDPLAKHGADSSAIVMKCKMDEMEDSTGILGIMRPTKFRAEITNASERVICVRLPEPDEGVGGANGEAEKVAVTLLHEKGSGESFREIVRRLKTEWTLEDGGIVGVL